MRILYLDCETNGLPAAGRHYFNDTDKWPYTVSVSWQLRSAGALVQEYDAIVKPRAGMVWDLGAQRFHGISKEKAEQEGQDIGDVLAALRDAIAGADLVVAHNMEFDKFTLLAEAVRLRGDPLGGGEEAEEWLWPSDKHEVCTMNWAIDIVKALPFKNGHFKFPRLEELHRKLFGSAFEAPLHTSKNDVACLVKCHHELLRWCGGTVTPKQ